MNNIIKKIHRFLFPSKYYVNNVTKPLNDLEKGDKLYVMHVPDLDKKPIATSLTALDEVELEIATVDLPTAKKFKTSYLVVMLNKINYRLLSGIHYEVPTVNQPVMELKLYRKDRTNTLYINKYNGILIVTTDKNVLAKIIKQMATVIGQRINERVKEKEKYKQEIYGIYNWEGMEMNYTYSLITNLKKTYSKLHNKLLLM